MHEIFLIEKYHFVVNFTINKIQNVIEFGPFDFNDVYFRVFTSFCSFICVLVALPIHDVQNLILDYYGTTCAWNIQLGHVCKIEIKHDRLTVGECLPFWNQYVIWTEVLLRAHSVMNCASNDENVGFFIFDVLSDRIVLFRLHFVLESHDILVLRVISLRIEILRIVIYGFECFIHIENNYCILLLLTR